MNNYTIFGSKTVDVVIEMGLGACIAVWESLARELGKNHGVLVYERAGINHSDMTGKYGIWQKQPRFCCKDRAIMAGDHESVFRLFRESNMDAGKEKHALYSFNGTGINYRERE